MGARFLRTLLFGALVPATFLVLIPAMILNVTGTEGEGGLVRLVGLVPLVLGIAVSPGASPVSSWKAKARPRRMTRHTVS